MINVKDLAYLPRIYEDPDTRVYLLETSDYGIPVVVKLPSHDFSLSKDIYRFVNEYEITKGLRIKGVRQALDYMTIDTLPVLILKYVPGGTVRNVIVGKHRTLREALSVAISIAGALDEVHRKKIVHHNINSDNIVIDHNGEATIIDFCLASQGDRNVGRTGMPDLSEARTQYISPEQTGRINRPVDYRTDLYSLGVVLYEMFAGHLPFESIGTPELIHDIIARKPVPVSETNPIVPVAVSDVVLKLLAKNAEDRYQSSYGVKIDLEECMAQLLVSGRIEPFEIGKNDRPDVPVIPKKLYGRDADIRQLTEAVDAVCDGTGRIVLISGNPGVGKSALAGYVEKYVREKGCYFISGRQDEYQRNLPYNALIQAFSRLVDLLLAESREDLARWKARISHALGANAGLLIDAIPRLGLILGPQPPSAEPVAAEAQNRFRFAFQSFVQAMAHREHPLVLFVDNLQWADVASLDLLQLLLGSTGNEYLLFVGAYRDSDVGPSHPLAPVIKALSGPKTRTLMIGLSNLAPDVLNLLVADTLKSDAVHVKPLSDLVYRKTEGNPLFAIQFLLSLYEDRLLVFNYDTRQWEWEIEQIRRISITDNVITLATQKIQKLPAKTLELLSLAACIGSSFSIDSLAEVAGQPVEYTFEHLWKAVDEGLVRLQEDHAPALSPEAFRQLPPETALEFIHDRVRTAAYSRLPRRLRRLTHLKAGRALLGKTPAARIPEDIFNITNHLNEGFPYVYDESERIRMVELNLLAGRKAKREAAYRSAIWYLSMGLGMLPADKWTRYYDLTLDLYMEAVEADYLSANFERAELLSSEILDHASDLLIRVRVYDLRVRSYTAGNQNKEAIRSGVEALEMLDVFLPRNAEDQKASVKALRQELPEKHSIIEGLTALPPMEDPRHLAAMRVLMNLATPAYQTDFRLLALIVSTMVKMSVRHGNSPMAAFAYGWYAVILCETSSDIETAYRYGRLSLDVISQFKASELEARVRFLFNVFVRPWKEHTRESIDPLLEVYRLGTQTGDLEYAYSAAVHYSIFLFLVGRPLEQIRQNHEEYFTNIDRFVPEFQGNLGRIWSQTVLNLTGSSADPERLTGYMLDESRVLPVWIVKENYVLVFCMLCCRTMLQYLFGDHAGAVVSARQAEEYEEAGKGYVYLTDFYFFYALSLLATCEDAVEPVKKESITRAAQLAEKVKARAAHAPMNYLHKYHLIVAEQARASGQTARAAEYYSLAIKGAKEQGYVNDEALAYEREAGFYLAVGRDDFAGLCIRKACDCYRLWGASRKVGDIDKRYRYLLGKERPVSMDTTTIIEASLVLSQEIQLDQLLNKMITLVVENAGAEKGILIENRNGRLVVRAKGEIGREELVTMQETPFETSGEVPVPVINYVARTQTAVVLDNAYYNSSYATDRYISEHRTKSLLCLPIVYHGALTGILYLENNLATDVFTPDRLELLKAIASQAAVSMENAHIYEALRDSETRFRALAETSTVAIIVYRLNILYVNPATEQLTGFTRDELLKMSLWEFAHPDSRQAVEERVKQRLEGRATPSHYEFKIIRKDGEERWVDASATRFQYENQPAGLAVFLDITERKRAEMALADAKAQAELYLDVMGHDIMNMNQIGIGFLELALESLHMDESTRELIARPLEALESSTKLINNVRKLQRIKEGGFALSRVDVYSVIRDLIPKYSSIPGRAISIHFSGCDCTVMANELLTDVFTNLLGNAIKHSTGDLTLDICMDKVRQEDREYCRVSVEDNGPGISSDLKARLFARTEKEGRRAGGRGLGLYLIKTLVEDFHGHVWVENRVPDDVSKGSRFVILLPAED